MRIFWRYLSILVAAALIALNISSCGSKPTLTYNEDHSMVLVPGATVVIGGEYNADYDQTNSFQLDLHAYWLGTKEVAAADFAKFLRATGRQSPATADAQDLPASAVSWFEAVEYCNWLSQTEGLAKVYQIENKSVKADWKANGYRLPSEAEYDYAVHGGPYSEHTYFPGSSNVDEVAHYASNSNGPAPRGTLKPNELGLYDMTGNVAEWVWDVYGMFPDGLQPDYHGPDGGDFRVIRGGSWNSFADNVRVGNRNFYPPDSHEPTVGFRVARNATGDYAKVTITQVQEIPLPTPPANAAYKDPTLTVPQRVADLLSRMSLNEKIGQMTQIAYEFLQGSEAVSQFGLGSLLSGGDFEPGEGNPVDWANLVDSYQKVALSTRLGIPLLFGIDSVHGAAKVRNATIFPHNIGLGAANDTALLEQMGAVVAEEMRASGLTWNFAPCLAVSQDERWGRSYESFSENPIIVSRLGSAYIRGLQGKSLGSQSVLATAKHYLADGGTQGGVDRGNAVIPEAELRRLHLAPYVAAIREGTACVMASFSSWNDLQMHANKKMLVDVLRNELGFKGVLISDWGAQKLLPGNPPQQIKTMVNAGVDICMVPDDIGRNGFTVLLHDLVLAGEVPLERIDEAVGRILTLKFRLGLFEKPFGEPKAAAKVGSPDHRALARALVAKSLVVLKNQGVLPIRAKTIWITGSLANDSQAQCGGWTMGWQGSPHAVAGATTIQAALISRAKTAGIVAMPVAPTAFPAGPAPDLAIVVSGERPYAEYEGDRQDLSLPEADQKLVAALRKQQVPVLLVLVSGRPLIISDLLPELSALVAAWLPGSEGAGVADVLFGDVKSTGRLPVSWPVSNQQIPVNAGDGKTPLFPLGFGLDL